MSLVTLVSTSVARGASRKAMKLRLQTEVASCYFLGLYLSSSGPLNSGMCPEKGDEAGEGSEAQF